MELTKGDLNSCTQKVVHQMGEELETWGGVPYGLVIK
jgi:hypothetical protein